jgi:penicillin-binding protein-related factor A (putative recombinase)
MINRTNEAYERLGRACITRKSIPGKYLVRRGEVRRGLSLPDGAATDFRADRGPARLAVGSLSRSARSATSHGSGDGSGTHAERYQFVPESKAEPDYGGVLAPAGRAIFYDAKTTRRGVLDFDNLHPHQIEFLERAVRCGAVAGFLVEFSLHQAVFFLPIQVLLRWRAESSRKSLPYRFFSERLIQASSGRGMLIFDYLAAIESQEERYGRDFIDLCIVV